MWGEMRTRHHMQPMTTRNQGDRSVNNQKATLYRSRGGISLLLNREAQTISFSGRDDIGFYTVPVDVAAYAVREFGAFVARPAPEEATP